MSLEIQDILRAQEVHRWNIVATIRNQSLAEHTFNVVFIGRAICKELGKPDGEVIKTALEHDLDEIVTGDIPTPTKQRMKIMGFNPDSIHDRKNTPTRSGESQTIVKVADMIEASWFIGQNCVTRHAKEVAERMRSRTDKYISDLANEPRPEMWNNKKIAKAARKVWHQIRNGEIRI